ncbi:MAG: Amuc_1100 family pilus-like protein [Candidatus Methylacidiphilales bacterium]|nr:Amuc_1100 family pilus-like protein [Candidatus Methylacidiphilales bacterium]
MKQIPQHLLFGIIGFVVIGLLGGGAWYWTAGQLETALAERTSITEKLQQVQSKGFSPTSQNLKLLEGNKEAVSALAKEILPQLDRAASRFAPFLGPDKKGLPQETWKEKLVSVREDLKKRADQGNVQTADDFYFGFKRYRVASPPAGATHDIGIQLAALEEISRLLIEAKVGEIREIRRVMVEDSGAVGGTTSEESINAAVVEGTGGLYRVFPFEVKFKSSPSAFNAFVNALGRSPMIFITRFVVVENEKNTVPKRSEFANSAAKEGEGAKLLVPIVGQEDLVARIRIDLIYWKADASGEKPGNPNAKPKPAQP